MLSMKIKEKFQREVVIDNLPMFLETAMDWFSETFEPEDIFTQSELEQWAEENGYYKPNNPQLRRLRMSKTHDFQGALDNWPIINGKMETYALGDRWLFEYEEAIKSALELGIRAQEFKFPESRHNGKKLHECLCKEWLKSSDLEKETP